MLAIVVHQEALFFPLVREYVHAAVSKVCPNLLHSFETRSIILQWSTYILHALYLSPLYCEKSPFPLSFFFLLQCLSSVLVENRSKLFSTEIQFNFPNESSSLQRAQKKVIHFFCTDWNFLEVLIRKNHKEVHP